MKKAFLMRGSRFSPSDEATDDCTPIFLAIADYATINRPACADVSYFIGTERARMQRGSADLIVEP